MSITQSQAWILSSIKWKTIDLIAKNALANTDEGLHLKGMNTSNWSGFNAHPSDAGGEARESLF